jgi:hypothetical protein
MTDAAVIARDMDAETGDVNNAKSLARSDNVPDGLDQLSESFGGRAPWSREV